MPPFAHRLRVRYHECDPQGIVFNSHHFAYFDVVLTELWRAAFGSYGAMVASGPTSRWSTPRRRSTARRGSTTSSTSR